MFLSKKNAIYFNKPKTNDPLKPKRMLAGIYHINQGGMMKMKIKISILIIQSKHSPNPSLTIYLLAMILPI